MIMEHYKLTLNRDLIDPNFSGYKLSLDPLPVYRLSLETDVDAKQLVSNDFYSYQHLKAFGLHNHLFVDPWNKDSVWFVDEKWHVSKVTMATETTLSGPTDHFTIPDASNRQLIPDRVNVTLHFTSNSWCVVTDGTGWLYLLKTGDRSQDDNWKEGYSGQPLGEGKRFIVLNSIWHSLDKMCYLDVLCLHVEKHPDQPDDDNSSAFITKLEWLTFSSDNENSFVLSRLRTLQSTDVPDYVALHPHGSSVIVACRRPIRFTYDSLKSISEPANAKKTSEAAENDVKPPSYTWTQNEDEVTVRFKLAPEIQKADISCQISVKHLQLKILESESTLLSGDLIHSVKADESTWLINDEHMLELHLFKAGCETWDGVVVGDNSGQFVVDPEQLAAINEQLAPYTSDVMNPDPERQKKPFNIEQLEECDSLPDDLTAIWCLNGETHEAVQQIDISSNQWLFSGPSTANHLPVLCLRHDVDGTVWRPESNEMGNLSWQHVSTFNAFGYVQASKQERKFTVNAPNFSYVAIVDCIRHIFIYRQPSAIVSPLRNRKTGETVGSVAKQQVVSLETDGQILGILANNQRIFAFAGKTVYAIRVNDD